MQQEDVFPMFDKIRKKKYKFIGFAIYVYWRDREVGKKNNFTERSMEV